MSSPHYRQRAKRLVAMIKELRGIARVPNPDQRPKDPKKHHAFDEADSTRVDKGTLHYWLAPYAVEESRRNMSPGERLDAVLKDTPPTDSVKY